MERPDPSGRPTPTVPLALKESDREQEARSSTKTPAFLVFHIWVVLLFILLFLG